MWQQISFVPLRTMHPARQQVILLARFLFVTGLVLRHQGQRGIRVLFEKKWFHVVLLCAGSAFLLSGAFSGNIWFDESYSVAISNNTFAEIWRIGSYDVHPVLFYWALHVLNLIFGTNILVYRLFTVAGAIALAVLGLTHIRKDFGPVPGVLFTLFACFTPYIANMAIEIRMYSWATFAVMVCAIYAFRIAWELYKRRANSPGAKIPLKAVPLHWWALFFVSSLASAYLHYFGVLSAFTINLMLLVFLALHAREYKRFLLAFAGQALVQVLAYLPWLLALVSQLSVVSNTYWANFEFPGTLRELLTYPVSTMQVVYAGWYGEYGIVLQAVIVAAFASLAISGVLLLVKAIRLEWSFLRVKYGKASSAAEDTSHLRNRVTVEYAEDKRCARSSVYFACMAGVAVYMGVIVIGLIASVIMDSYMVYYRYAFVAIGPLLLAIALVLSLTTSKKLAATFCGSFLCLAFVSQVLLVSDTSSSENWEVNTYFEQVFGEAQEDQDARQREAEGESGAKQALVLSSDIGIQGPLCVQYPGITQTYLDWQPGKWAGAYEAYAPTLVSVKTWDQALDSYCGKFVVLGQSKDGCVPKDVQDILNKEDANCLEIKTFFHPYERAYFTVALMETANV